MSCQDVAMETEVRPSERIFKCVRCDFSSAHKMKLKEHKLDHNLLNLTQFHEELVKPFKCDKCHYSSSLSFDLRIHKVTEHKNEMKTTQPNTTQPKMILHPTVTTQPTTTQPTIPTEQKVYSNYKRNHGRDISNASGI